MRWDTSTTRPTSATWSRRASNLSEPDPLNRLPALPDVPTNAEAGIPDLESDTLTGIVAPAGTPKEIVDLLYGEIKKIVADHLNVDIAKVTDDIDRRFSFHTPIAAVMELVNELSRETGGPDSRFAAETAVSLIQPYAPHVAEELWQLLGRERLWEEPWPVHDPAMLARSEVVLVVQVNGKVRDRIEVPAGLPEDELIARARASESRECRSRG